MLRLVCISGFGSCLTKAEKKTVEDWDVVTYSTANWLFFFVHDERTDILQSYAGGKKVVDTMCITLASFLALVCLGLHGRSECFSFIDAVGVKNRSLQIWGRKFSKLDWARSWAILSMRLAVLQAGSGTRWPPEVLSDLCFPVASDSFSQKRQESISVRRKEYPGKCVYQCIRAGNMKWNK